MKINLRRNPFLPMKCKVRGETRWKIDLLPSVAGKRIRKFFITELAALTEGERLKDQIKNQGITSLDQPKGLSVERATEMFLDYKNGKVGARHYYTLATYLKDMRKYFKNAEITSITAFQLEQWFNRTNWSDRSRYTAFSYARMFFNWLERHDLVEKNPARRCEIPKKGDQKNHCLSPYEWNRLIKLTKNDPLMRGYLCLGLFAGLRCIEIQRLDWSACDWEEKEIHVGRDVSKQSTGIKERYVPMTEAFLKHCPNGLHGKVIPITERNFRKRRKILKNAMGWKRWPENCLRDTYASNELALTEDAGKVAYRLGHSSTKMVQTVYARAVKRRDAGLWKQGSLEAGATTENVRLALLERFAAVESPSGIFLRMRHELSNAF